MQHWRNLEHHVGEPCPVERSAHAAVCLGYGGDRPQLLITGGKGVSNKILKDAWILDMQSGKWREVRINEDVCDIHIRSCHFRIGTIVFPI